MVWRTLGSIVFLYRILVSYLFQQVIILVGLKLRLSSWQLKSQSHYLIPSLAAWSLTLCLGFRHQQRFRRLVHSM